MHFKDALQLELELEDKDVLQLELEDVLQLLQQIIDNTTLWCSWKCNKINRFEILIKHSS